MRIKITIGSNKPEQGFAILKECPKCKAFTILLWCKPRKKGVQRKK
jgi:hypothetical protein